MFTIMAALICKTELVLQKLFRTEHFLLNLAAVSFSTSRVQSLNQKWRQQQKLPTNPNACGILTDKPDFSYLDGRPSALGVGMKNRLDKQRKYAETIVKLSKEMDFAVERHTALEQEKEKERQRILDSKLKPKGHMSLKSK